jgi:hypothetical protein
MRAQIEKSHWMNKKWSLICKGAPNFEGIGGRMERGSPGGRTANRLHSIVRLFSTCAARPAITSVQKCYFYGEYLLLLLGSQFFQLARLMSGAQSLLCDSEGAVGDFDGA